MRHIHLSGISLVAIVVSALYMLIYAALFHDAEPESLADRVALFTGFFTPLALIWVVAGFCQQSGAIQDTRRALEIAEQSERDRVRAAQPIFHMPNKPEDEIYFRLVLINRGATATEIYMESEACPDMVIKKGLFEYRESWKIDWPASLRAMKQPLVLKFRYKDANHVDRAQEYLLNGDEFKRKGSLPIGY